jgi:NADPH2 dehydrogenase
MKIFEEYKVKDLLLKNKIVMPPMCMFSADEAGYANEFHFTHYVSRAVGGVGLIILEATAVSPNGRITDKDLGLWEDGQISGLKQIVQACHDQGSKVAVQLGHAGRKCTAPNESIVAPSAIAFDDNSQIPHQLTTNEIKSVADDFKKAAERAGKAGFDAIEIHAAHGYLISEFLSPISNKREDEYNGNFINNGRFLKEVLEAVREVWPENKPIIVRVSADDYLPGGVTPQFMSGILNEFISLFDVLHVSSGGVAHAEIDTYPGYQVEAASYLRNSCSIPVIAVGLINTPDTAEEIIANKRADLVAIGRELLRNPYWVLNIAREKGIPYEYPKQYLRSFN